MLMMGVMQAGLAIHAPCFEYSEGCTLLLLPSTWIKVVSVVTSVCFTKRRGCECDYLEGYKDACEKERSSTDSQRDTHPFVSENERSR